MFRMQLLPQKARVVMGVPVAAGGSRETGADDLNGLAGIESLRVWLDGTLRDDAVSEGAGGMAAGGA